MAGEEKMKRLLETASIARVGELARIILSLQFNAT
jgi:hypothetical protein